jgi:hypothetical protein
VTVGLAMEWAGLASTPGSCSRRFSVVRDFARWFQCLDPASETIPAALLPGRGPRQMPYLFIDNDVAALMSAARTI